TRGRAARDPEDNTGPLDSARNRVRFTLFATASRGPASATRAQPFGGWGPLTRDAPRVRAARAASRRTCHPHQALGRLFRGGASADAGAAGAPAVEAA